MEGTKARGALAHPPTDPTAVCLAWDRQGQHEACPRTSRGILSSLCGRVAKVVACVLVPNAFISRSACIWIRAFSEPRLQVKPSTCNTTTVCISKCLPHANSRSPFHDDLLLNTFLHSHPQEACQNQALQAMHGHPEPSTGMGHAPAKHNTVAGPNGSRKCQSQQSCLPYSHCVMHMQDGNHIASTLPWRVAVTAPGSALHCKVLLGLKRERSEEDERGWHGIR